MEHLFQGSSVKRGAQGAKGFEERLRLVRNSRTRLVPELLDGHAAPGKLMRLAEVLEPLNGRLPLILGGLRRRLPRLPNGDRFRDYVFGRAVLAGANGIIDDTFDPGGEMNSHHQPPCT